MTQARSGAARASGSLRPFLVAAAWTALSAPLLAFQDPAAREMPVPAAPSAVAPAPQAPAVLAGERLDPSAFGPFVIEAMDAVVARQERAGYENGPSPKLRNGAQGEWEVPSMRFSERPHSGTKHLINRWGDTRLGIGFERVVDLEGAWLAGQGTLGVWTTGVQAVGYRDGVEVARTEWFRRIGEQPAWFAMGLEDVDRVEFVAEAVIDGAGWYALDDLTYAFEGPDAAQAVVLDFEDLAFGTRLSGSGYAGLVWEVGTGDFTQPAQDARVVPPPQTPPGLIGPDLEGDGGQKAAQGGSGTTPTLLDEFIGPAFGDAGANLIPPDTCGAVGTTHFLAATNANISVYVKATGQRVLNVSLGSFWNSGQFIGDPRVVYDEHHDRFVVIASNFSNGIWFAYSLSGNPTGTWFKTFINQAQGSDAGKWPDYPTLGVDANGVYTASFMVGGQNLMSIFAIDKAPLLSGTPSLGTVSAWRLLPWEGAIQPCVTHGSSGGVYLVSANGSNNLRLRQITGPLSGPSLVEKGFVSVPFYSSAPDAPQAGTQADLDTIDFRPMNAEYRNGSVWTTHCINVGGRAAVRWYEVDVNTVSTAQVGTISDPVLSYFMPGLAVNANDEMLIGFSGSSPSDFVGAYLTGRLASDPPNETGPPLEYKDGEAPYTQISSSGTNRWGDYSLSSVDPVDDLGFWTIQEYARLGNTWVTRIANADFGCQVDTYCTAKLSSNFCTPTISTSGQPSLAQAATFVISTSSMETATSAISFFGVNGPAAAPFQGGFLCVANPIFRLPGKNTGGSGTCAGSIAYTLADILFNAGGSQVVPGATVNLQSWGRDLGDAFGSSLSGGVQFGVCP